MSPGVCRFRFFFLAFLLTFCLLFHAGAETITLSIDDAVQRALDSSINLKKSSIDLAQAGYSASHLWAEVFPTFSLGGTLTFLPATALLTDPGFDYNGPSYSFSLGLSFSPNLSFKASMDRIELAYRAQMLSYENASRQLEIQVIKNFLNLITRRENAAFMEENLEKARLKQDRERAAWQNGLLSELNWLQSQLSVETARYNLIDAQGTYQNALREFLALLGIDAGTDIELRGTIEIAPVSYDAEALILEYLPKRPDIISQRQTIERLELAKSISTMDSRLPKLSLSTQWQGSGSTGGSFSDRLSGSLTVNIPIDSWIPGTKQNQNLRSADADIEKARLDLQNVETQAKTQIRALISNLENTWSSLEVARLRVSIAERNAAAAEISFQNGTVESQTLEDSRRDLTDARQRLLQGEYSYQSLLLDLASALNVDWKTLVMQ